MQLCLLDLCEEMFTITAFSTEPVQETDHYISIQTPHNVSGEPKDANLALREISPAVWTCQMY